MLIPYFFAFGSNNNYWILGSHAGIFWILASLLLLHSIFKRSLLQKLILLTPIVLIVQLISVIHLNKKFDNPYRQTGPLKSNNTETKINSNGAILKLSSNYASYINNLRIVAIKSGFKKNDPVIDLTGQSPGILYILGAENLGYAWLSGGYPGSLKQATSYLNLISCKKISNAWIIYEINGPRSISNELIMYQGAKFPEEYKLEGSWKTAIGAGGYNIERVQQLYKPQNPIKILNKCQKLRYERKNNK